MEYVNLEHIADILNGYNFKSSNYVNDGVRVIRITNVQQGYLEDKDPVFYEYTKDLDKYMLKENDLLMSLTGNVGRVGMLVSSLLPAGLNQRVACIRCKNDNFNIKFLFYFFNNELFRKNAISNSNGVAQLNLSTEWLKKVKIPAYDENKQYKIVGELDKIVELIDDNKKQLSNLDNIVKSQFIEMFGKLEDTEYPIDTLNNICEFIKDGTHQTPTYTEDEDGYIFVSSKDVTSGKIDWDNTKRIPKELHDQLYSRIAPKKNDILLSKNGTIGFAVLVEEDRIFDIYVSLAILRQNKLNPVFMKEQLNAEDCQKQFYSSLKGVGVPNLHIGEIKKTKVIVPPIELQNKFADFVQQIDKSKFNMKDIIIVMVICLKIYFGQFILYN